MSRIESHIGARPRFDAASSGEQTDYEITSSLTRPAGHNSDGVR